MDKASFPQCTAVHWLREPWCAWCAWGAFNSTEAESSWRQRSEDASRMQVMQLPCYSFLSGGGGPVVVVVFAGLKLCNIFCSLNQMFSYRPPIRVLVFTGVMSFPSSTSSSQLELQHKIQTLDEIPKLSTHHLASLTHWRQATPSTIRSCWLQPASSR